MRLKITFKVLNQGQAIPLPYQYELGSWIYGLIRQENSEFSDFLHSKGYRKEGRTFKFFTFSNFQIPKYKYENNKLVVWSSEISFVVSTLLEEVNLNIFKSLFINKFLKLGNRSASIDLYVISVEGIPLRLKEQESYLLRTTSPLVVSQPELKNNGKLYHQYLFPSHDKFEDYFFQNLIRKYQTATKYELVDKINTDKNMRIELLSDKIKRCGIKIRANTKSETKIIGYQYDFRITAPKKIVEMGLAAGFGENNAMGFGSTQLI